MEWLSILWHVPNRTWSPAQHRTMQAATSTYGIRSSAVLLALVVLGLSIRGYLASQDAALTAQKQEARRKQSELLVDAVLAAPAEAVPYAINALEQFRTDAAPMLRRRLDDNTVDQQQRLRSTAVLAHFGDVRHGLLIQHIGTAPAGECETIVQALNHSATVAIRQLHDLARTADGEQNWPLKARCGITMLHLGDTIVAGEMTTLRPDPTQRIKLIDELRHWHGDLKRLVAVTSTSRDPALSSGICLGIGSISADNLPAADISAVRPTIAGWYSNSPHLDTRSAAEWVLKQWHQPVPQSAPTEPLAEDRDCYMHSNHMTMVRIQAVDPPTGKNATSTKMCWLSDREVSRRIYQRFIDDPACAADLKPSEWKGASTARSPTLEHPVQTVNWIDALLFCNWLSRVEHHRPCYVWSGSAWELDSNADGYRLPFEDEWEKACRAGTTTRFVSGDDESYLSWFAVYESNHTAPCGSKMPNGWGLFDLHGNVFEWCETPRNNSNNGGPADPGSDPNFGTIRALRGGAFDYSSFIADVDRREKAGERYRSYTIGFRPARNY